MISLREFDPTMSPTRKIDPPQADKIDIVLVSMRKLNCAALRVTMRAVMRQPGGDPTILKCDPQIGVTAKICLFRERMLMIKLVRRWAGRRWQSVEPESVVRWIKPPAIHRPRVRFGVVMANERPTRFVRVLDGATAMHQIGMPDENVALAREKSFLLQISQLYFALNVRAPVGEFLISKVM